MSCRGCRFFFKQKTAYELRISDWSSDVCSSDLLPRPQDLLAEPGRPERRQHHVRRARDRVIRDAGMGREVARDEVHGLATRGDDEAVAGRLVVGWSAALLRVTSSTTGLVMSLMVRSPVTFSLPSQAASTFVFLKVAAGNLRASKKSALSRCLSKSDRKSTRLNSSH